MGDIADWINDSGQEAEFYGHRREPILVSNKCPRCKGVLVRRVNSHTKCGFLGCENFPKCRYSR